MPKKNPEFELLKTHYAILQKQLEEIKKEPQDFPVTGCGDNSCLIEKPHGMATNGGCRCELFKFQRAFRWQKRKILFLQETIKDLKS